MKCTKRVLALILAAVMVLGMSVFTMAAQQDTGFADVAADANYAQAVAWCYENRLMNGVEDGANFAPDGSMNRAMLATILYRQAGEPKVDGDPDFTDTLPGVWYSNAITWAAERNLLRGYGNGLFGVEDPVSKEMLQVVIARQNGEDPAWTGDPALAVDATRAEAAVALYETFYEPEPTPTRQPSSSGSSRPSGSGSGGSSTTPTPTPTQTPEPTPTITPDPTPTPEPSPEPTPTPAPEPDDSPKALVAYFSATNNTEGVAQNIVNVLGEDTADLFEIVPAVPYTSADLNYGDNSSRTSLEQNDASARPAIADTCTVENMEDYDIIFLGYPIWWGQAPKILYTFLESYDWNGKTIVPFCTSASSGVGSSATNLHGLAEGATWKSGQRFSGSASQSAVKSWIDGLGLSLSAE